MTWKQIIQVLITSYIFGLVLITEVWESPEWYKALVFSVVFTLVAYLLVRRYDRMRAKEILAARRESMTFVQEWPGKGWVDLGERYEGLYTVVLNPRDLEAEREEWLKLLEQSGNQAALPDVAEDLKIPTEVVYAKDGERARETLEEYEEHCRSVIDKLEVAYNVRYKKEKGGEVYLEDILLRRVTR